MFCAQSGENSRGKLQNVLANSTADHGLLKSWFLDVTFSNSRPWPKTVLALSHSIDANILGATNIVQRFKNYVC